jgi:hypothetical protein
MVSGLERRDDESIIPTNPVKVRSRRASSDPEVVVPVATASTRSPCDASCSFTASSSARVSSDMVRSPSAVLARAHIERMVPGAPFTKASS